MKTPAQRDVIGGNWRGRLLRLLGDAASVLVDDRRAVGERIHQARRLAKEGRALLKLAPPALADDARRHRAALRAIRRQFGPARDARVDLELAEKRKPRSKAAQSAAGFLRSKLGAVCALEEAALTPQKLDAAASSLTTIAQAIAGWRLLRHADALFRDRIAKAYRAARRLTPDGDEPALAAIHELRSAVVDHLYQIALITEANARMARRAERLHRLREDLGAYLDSIRLQQAAGELAPGEKLQASHSGGKRLGRGLAAASRLFADRPAAFRAQLDS